MSKFGSYRNTSVYIPNTAYIIISKEVAAYNVSKGLLFPIQNTPCPPNQMCAQVVRYSYVNTNCQCITQPCSGCTPTPPEYVPSDAKIYSVMPDCPSNARCAPTLYAAKGKVNPVLEIPSGATTTSNNNIGSMLTKKFDNMAVGVLVAAWGIDGYLAYKFWGKSMMWKVGIVAFTAVNAYGTMRYLKKRKANASDTVATTTTNDDKSSLVSEIASKALSKADKAPTQAQKDELIKKISTLSIEDLKIAKEYVTELVAIDFKQAPEISMKKFGDLVTKFNGKYGMEKMQKIGDLLK